MRISERFKWEWRGRAKCLDLPIDLFDLSDTRAYIREHDLDAPATPTTIASALCDGCPVMRECAADALVDKPRPVGVVRGGIWCSPAYWRQTAEKLSRVAAGQVPPSPGPGHVPAPVAARAGTGGPGGPVGAGGRRRG